MHARRIGPFTVSAVSLGCMNLSHAYGVPPPPEQAEAVLHRALDLGVTLFDTAALECEQLAQLDSKDMDHACWGQLARTLARHLARAEVRGVVITHGTDTLEELDAKYIRRGMPRFHPDNYARNLKLGVNQLSRSTRSCCATASSPPKPCSAR